MSIELQDVEHRYPGTDHGVLGVSLTVAREELVTVIGASGCGKSTLLRLVAGLLPVQQGRLAIDGRPMAGVPPWQRPVGMVFQSYALFRHLNVLDNVAYGLRMRKVGLAGRRNRALEVLDSVGMASHANRRVDQLSGGQQQRVALARALAFGPSVLLLDEPLAALDAHLRTRLCDEIRDAHRRSGAATLLVTHDQHEALMLADRVAVMARGRLVQVASPRQLYDRPASLEVARFVGHANLLAAQVLAPGRVACELGELRADTSAHAAGTAVTLLVRPEALQADPPAGAVNRLVGRTTRERFLGPTSRWDFTVPGTTPRRQTVLLCEGPVVAREAVALDPQRLLLLEAGEPASGTSFPISSTAPHGDPS
ncbi:MAG: hypothetical protein RLZ83_506 [Pseudomonadota bacterium]|jgi:putative spermidine/putrescine transport system ATP-binding protein